MSRLIMDVKLSQGVKKIERLQRLQLCIDKLRNKKNTFFTLHKQGHIVSRWLSGDKTHKKILALYE